MGVLMTRLWWGGNPDTADPESGLSQRDIYTVRKGWAVVYKDSAGSGTELLSRLFRAYPENKEFFKMIHNMEEIEFVKNFQFKAHVVNVMAYLNTTVENLHQPKVVVALMEKLGDSHNKRNIRKENFEHLKDVLVKLLIEVLKLDNESLASWARLVEFMYKNIFSQLA